MQHIDYSKYKNIDKSTALLLDEKNDFSLLILENQNNDTEHFIYPLDNNYIQLFFSTKELCSVAFQMEHCKVPLQKNDSCLVYFKENHMNLLYELPPNSEVITVLIPVNYFHSLFSDEENYLLSFDNFVVGKPIIETKETPLNLQSILLQLTGNSQGNSLQKLYLKAKVYELFSLYFSSNDETNTDHCPYIANEETAAKIKQVKDIVIEQMAHPPSLEELSKTVGLNLKKLKEGFKELYGAPVFTFLLNYKLEYAKKLLLENKLNVNEIGLKIGYSTSSHFIAAFKRKFGITPKQFVKQSL